MSETTLMSRIQEMRHKYIETSDEHHCHEDYNCQNLRKAKKIKKKLIALEKERCHRLIEHHDVTKIDQQIASLKNDFIKDSTKENSKDF